MSREELENVIAEIVNICACPDCPVSRIHKDALEVIERLLAQERERVREMCAVVMKDFADEYEPGANISVKYLEGKYGTLSGEKAIRQLDLAAPSSTEEGGDAK